MCERQLDDLLAACDDDDDDGSGDINERLIEPTNNVSSSSEDEDDEEDDQFSAPRLVEINVKNAGNFVFCLFVVHFQTRKKKSRKLLT